MTYETWIREKSLISGQEYLGNQLIAQNASSKGYDAIINEYVYIDTYHVSDIFKKISEYNFKAGITTEVGDAILNHENAFKLKRYDTNDFPQ